MKTINHTILINKNYSVSKYLISYLLLGVTLVLLTFSGCKKKLPEVGSIDDLTPPKASFTYAQYDPSNYLEVTFSNLSISSTDYLWDFGDGNTSTEKEPIHIYPAYDTYTVKLTVKDKLNVESVIEKEIIISEPSAFIPPIIEGSFEDGQLPDGTGDGRDSWKNSALGGVIQITNSPVVDGVQAAKLTGDPSDKRIGYQMITVTENTVYDITFNYTMLDVQPGFLTVSILDGSPVASHAEALAATIGSKTVNNQSNPSSYIQETVSFFSGNKTEVAIYFFNDGTVETRLDDFSIDIGTGTVPPVAAFTYVPNAGNYLQIDFTNTSVNADTYMWDFGDGNSSTDLDPFHIYMVDGTYTVTLTVTSSQGSDMTSTTIDVEPPSNIVITNPSFIDEPIKNDNRIAWRNSDLESDAQSSFGIGSPVLQITTTARTGAWAGKLPTLENSADPRRWLYQEIIVDPNTDYEIKSWIRNKDAGVGSKITYEIYDAPFITASTIGDASKIIASEDYDASSGHDTNVYTETSLTFNSGSNSVVVLYIYNDYTLNGDPVTEESETFLDDFSITEL